jgi:hypothetical protein
MKIYTFYTPSHEVFLNEWFIPSLKNTNQDFELVVRKFDQKCSTGKFMDEGWNDTMSDKIDYILHSIDETPEGEYFIHADCDIQFFKDIKQNLQTVHYEMFDICAQSDMGSACCGFMIIRSNSKTKKLFQDIKTLIKKKIFPNDQIALNAIYKNYDVSLCLLGYQYFSVWMSNGGKVWHGEELQDIPDNLILHHANFSVGIQDKINLMNIVKNVQQLPS